MADDADRSQVVASGPARRRSGGDGDPPVYRPLRIAASYSWRLLAVAGVVAVAFYALSALALIVMPVFLALLLTAVLRPPASWLQSRGFPDWLAAVTVLGTLIVVIAGLLALIIPSFVGQLTELEQSLSSGADEAGSWLRDGPLGLSESEIDGYVADAKSYLSEHRAAIAGGVIGGLRATGQILVALGLTLVITFFFLKDGDEIREWLIRLARPRFRSDIGEMASRSWDALAGYLRGVTATALFDAVFIGLALLLIGVPAVLPLALLTFFSAYVPVAGAVLAGFVAVLVALASEGIEAAMLVLAAVIAVQQIEGNVMQPFLVGSAVGVHPIPILLAVTAGAILGGIVGAVIATPILAVATRIGGYLREQERTDAGEQGDDELPAATGETQLPA